MALTIPTIESAPTFDGQSISDATDWSSMANAVNGSGLISGGAVTAGSGMSVNVAAGTGAFQGVGFSWSAVTNFAITAASASDRRDLVAVTSSGLVVGVLGTACGTAGWTRSSTGLPPVKPPLFPANSILLGEVYVASTTSSLAAGNLIDKRTLLMQDSGWLTIANGAMTNSWVNAGSISGAFQYRMIGNRVFLQGSITGGTSANAAFTLPAGYRPTRTQNLTGNTQGTFSTVIFTISTSGVCVPFFNSAGSATPITFDGTSFTVD